MSIKRTHKMTLPLLLLISALILSSCGAKESIPELNEIIDQTSSSEDLQEELPARTFRVAFQPIVQTDPALISSDSEVFIANAVYDYIVDVDAKSNLIPRLATSWTISDDGLVYTFDLVKNASFHDESSFSADDVIWTFDRLRDPELGFATSSLYSNILSIEKKGEFSVIFTLENPNPFFLYDLSDNHALIIKNGTEDASDFNGTGPFKVSSYNPEDRVILEANPDYFIPGQSGLDSVEVIFFPDDIAMIDALRGGQIDLVLRMSTSLFKSLENEDGIETISIPTNGFDLVRLRSDREPGNNPAVIQAFKLATDRKVILDLVHQGFGSVGNDSPIGPLYDAYHDASVSPPARDIEAAKALLAEAGYPEGIELTLHVPDSGSRPDLAAVLKQQWSEANIFVEISVEPESVYYGDDGWLEVDLGITGWGSRPYPQFYLDVMLISGAAWNEAHFADPEFDALANTAGTTLNENERIEAYSQIQELLADRGPILIPYYFAQFGAINSDFEGFELKAFAGRTDLRTISIP